MTAKTSAICSVAATTHLEAISGKPLEECFWGGYPVYSDGVPSDRPLEIQADAPAVTISTISFRKEWYFSAAAAMVLGVSLKDTSYQELSWLLKERRHILTLPQVEEMMRRSDRGEQTGMRTDNSTTTAFIENVRGEVSVLTAHCNHDDNRRPEWVKFGQIYPLSYRHCYYGVYPLLVANLDISKLVL